ncbi:MAG TPA: hypothetical protein VFX38_03010 [Gammaproteobacteria bacterium]|nr:hypothetical protein [Gammaproteobacteria bacterium]
MAESSSPGLNSAQARHVLATFRHVDALLDRVTAQFQPRNDGDSTAAIRNDVSAAQAAALCEAVAGVRAELEKGAEALDLPATAPAVSARWVAATSARLALIALAELDARQLAAYGAITGESAARVARVRERLEERISALIGAVDQGQQT